MATLSLEQRKKFKSQLDAIQVQLNKIKEARASRSGQVAGASTSTAQNPALEFGAAGRGEGLTPEISAQIQTATEAGVPMSELGSPTGDGDETFLDAPDKFAATVPRLSSQQSQNFVSSVGLDGIINPNAVKGLTASEANRKLIQELKKRKGQVSASTSFAFNPETLNRTKRAIDKLGFSLDEANNDPFEPNEFKEENKRSAVELTEKEIAKLFNDPNDLLNAAQTNPAFQATLQDLLKNGGSVEGISKNISAGVTVDNQITNGLVNSGQLPENQRENVAQDSFNMLAGISNPKANQEAEEQAIEELIPESQIAQDEIARQAQIPDDLKTLYFGDEKTLGILDIRKNQAEEEIKLLEAQEKDAKRTARERASLQVDRNRAEVKKARATIEENRLRAKNYMTGALAKLGALKTTGAAPLALQTIETKYQGQITSLETSYEFANREIEIGLDEDLDGIENGTNEAILGIQQDLTKDTETVTKEILKAQQASEKEIYRITEQYARRLRTRTTKYTEDLKKAAEKYAKAFAKTASDANTASIASRLQPGEEIDEGVYVPDR